MGESDPKWQSPLQRFRTEGIVLQKSRRCGEPGCCVLPGMSGAIPFRVMVFHIPHVLEGEPVLFVEEVGKWRHFPGYQVIAAEELHGVDILWCKAGFLVAEWPQPFEDGLCVYQQEEVGYMLTGRLINCFEIVIPAQVFARIFGNTVINDNCSDKSTREGVV